MRVDIRLIKLMQAAAFLHLYDLSLFEDDDDDDDGDNFYEGTSIRLLPG